MVTTTRALDSRAPFEFGENWRRFLAVVNEERISAAERSLCDMLRLESLEGMTFLDLGSGSGMFSLAAVRLGAQRVHSLDIDSNSVGCALELKSRYAPEASNWTVERASVLDRDHIRSLGLFDVVYSWGVLHHTGDLSTALENAALSVTAGGRLMIAIYNDRGASTDRWRAIKRFYGYVPRPLRAAYVAAVMAPFELKSAVAATLRLRPQEYLRRWKPKRGMSRWHDMVDWVGGYPFEPATAGRVFDFYWARGFELVRLVTRPGQNEFVFTRAQ